jgi:hypothetical protein
MAETEKESRSRGEPRLSELHVRAVELRMAKLQGEKDLLRAPTPTKPEEKAELESRRRETLYNLAVEGAKIEHDFVALYRGRVSDALGGGLGTLGCLTVGPDGLPTCHIFCQLCVTSCTLCVTGCTYCWSCELSGPMWMPARTWCRSSPPTGD